MSADIEIVSLSINHLSDIRFDGSPFSPFDNLVIPEEHKKTVTALVQSHVRDSREHHQVKGEGKGLIIFLHGAPGTGKTSTAECVAAHTKRPLFRISCGDIGQTVQAVEANLEGSLTLARKWGCILLLQKADTLMEMEERDSADYNALVSVFLRTLENYSSIIFLTANSVGVFDEAFLCRIHMSLYYTVLDKANTFKSWTINLDRL